jgi:hypothetical protein
MDRRIREAGHGHNDVRLRVDRGGLAVEATGGNFNVTLRLLRFPLVFIKQIFHVFLECVVCSRPPPPTPYTTLPK